MRQFKRFAVLILLVSAFFTTGCDVEQIMNTITQVAQGVQQAAPAIQEAINAVQQVFPQNNNNNNNQAAAPAENPAPNDANVVIANPGDQEEVGTAPAANTGNNGGGNNTPAAASAAEAALANYQGGRLAPAEFARLFGPVAREASRTSGVPASIIIAQAALETGWGSSAIGDAKNLFGIKGTGPAGSITVPTREYINGRFVTIQDSFRKYNSWQESIEDHGRLLQNSRYAPAMAVRNNPEEFARQLQRCGYATDPEYASKLISIMRSNNLYQYDN